MADKTDNALAAFADSLQMGERPPIRLDNGDVNAEHFRWGYALLDRMVIGIMSGQVDPPRNFNPEQYRKVLDSYASSHNFDPKHLADHRTEAEKALDAARIIVESPEAVLEQASDVVEALEKAMQQAVDGCKAKIDEQVSNALMLKRGKSWGHLLKKIRRIQEMARQPIPSRTPKAHAPAWEAAHLLRFMLYTARRGTASGGGSTALMRITDHLCQMSCDIWEAEHKIEFTAEGVRRNRIQYEGVILTCPPGHWKTTILTSWLARRVCMRPRTQGIVLHAIADKSEEILQSVKNTVKPDYAMGRRCLALFPHIQLAAYDNTQAKLRIYDDNPPKSPTMLATGVGNKGLGSDADFLAMDDVVPQEDADQETERDRRKTKIGGTWMSRLRKASGDCFVFWIGNTWHRADAMMAYMAKAREGKISYRVSIQRCGGYPNFKPLCSEAMTSAQLRAMYHQIGPALYAAAYECRPMAEGRQVVRKLRFYDPSSSQHEQFLRAAEFYLSVDPAASTREKADRSALVYAAVGEVEWYEQVNGVEVRRHENRCRILDCWEIKARPGDVAEAIAMHGLSRNLDVVLVEAVSAFIGIVDDLQNRFGVEAVPISTSNRSKEIRLKAASQVLDDSAFDAGGGRATLEFPGVKQPDGTIAPDSRLGWLHEEILSFGAAASDHGVDAVTQLANHLARDGHIAVGAGAITERLRREVDWEANRTKQHLRQLIQEQRRVHAGWSQSPDIEDARFAACLN